VTLYQFKKHQRYHDDLAYMVLIDVDGEDMQFLDSWGRLFRMWTRTYASFLEKVE
jgi:hypothetical protein